MLNGPRRDHQEKPNIPIGWMEKYNVSMPYFTSELEAKVWKKNFTHNKYNLLKFYSEKYM